MARHIDLGSGEPWSGGSPEPSGEPEPGDVPAIGLGAYAVGLVTRPGPTVVRARGRRFWGPASVLGLAVGVLLLRSPDLAFDVAVLPVLVVLGLMLTFPAMGLIRLVCGAADGITDATASQAVLVGCFLVLPGAVLTVTDYALAAGLALLLGAVAALAATVGVTSVAFGCTPARSLAGAVLVIVLVLALAWVGGGVLDYLHAHSGSNVDLPA